jgi:hypothetical protein
MRQVGGKGIGRRGNPFATPGPSPTGAGLPRLASQGRQFGPQGPGQTARRWQHHQARSEAPGAHSSGTPKTWRTPSSAAGCNKPAGRRAEKTVEAGRNGKGGTSSDPGRSGPKVVCFFTEVRPGVDARRLCRWRGDSWTTPREASGRSRIRTGQVDVQGRTHPVPDESFERTVRSRECLRRRSQGQDHRAPSQKLEAGRTGMEPHGARVEARDRRGRAGKANDPHTCTAELPRARFTQTNTRLRYRGPA